VLPDQLRFLSQPAFLGPGAEVPVRRQIVIRGLLSSSSAETNPSVRPVAATL
jgi:hypothetical protein